ncbi:hypothetical protein HGA34_04215 [Candidatus Falkowbacteria bacterium]|nr:hypothetical protein [Candidatus Falkowbacteria bacterium]
MRRTFVALFLMALGWALAGCGASTANHQTSDTSLPAGKGAVSIDTQLFPVDNQTATLKVAKTVAGGGGGGGGISNQEMELRKRIHHVEFWFNDGKSYGQMQTIMVCQGRLSGKLIADPGNYMLEANFMTQSGAVIYRATTQVEVTSGMSTHATLVAQKSTFVYLEGRINRPTGSYTETEMGYSISIEEANGTGFSVGTGGRYNAAANRFDFGTVYPTSPMVNEAKIILTDDTGQTHKAVFTFDLIKAIDEANANGFVNYDWPAPGTIKIDVIFEDDNAGFVKAVNAVPVATPTRGNNNTTLARINLANTTTETAAIKTLTFRLWDCNYLSNLYLVRADLPQLLGSSTHFPVASITVDEYGVAIVTFTTDIHIPAGAMISINLQGDVSPDYPTMEMFNYQVTGASVVTETNQTVPFLGTDGMAVGIY